MNGLTTIIEQPLCHDQDRWLVYSTSRRALHLKYRIAQMGGMDMQLPGKILDFIHLFRLTFH